MSVSDVVVLDRSRVSLPGIALPVPPPTRIYIDGHLYRIAAPQSVLPPLINTVKVIWNWVSLAGRVAKNVQYVKIGTGGTASTSDPVTLKGIADAIMTAVVTAGVAGSVNNQWQLQSVTCRDNGGTSAVGNSSHAIIPGAATGAPQPPQVAICVSWVIADSYRGGKPRSYIPGVPDNALSTPGDSQIINSFALTLDNQWTVFLSTFNATLVLGTALQLGSVSHYTGHAVRPTPLFRAFLAVKIHERLDSQRRRSGRESSFAVTP